VRTDDLISPDVLRGEREQVVEFGRGNEIAKVGGISDVSVS
jgi:hypothetical protein